MVARLEKSFLPLTAKAMKEKKEVRWKRGDVLRFSKHVQDVWPFRVGAIRYGPLGQEVKDTMRGDNKWWPSTCFITDAEWQKLCNSPAS